MTTKWSALSVAVAAVVLAAALHTAVYTPADSVTAPHGATPETHGGNDAQSSGVFFGCLFTGETRWDRSHMSSGTLPKAEAQWRRGASKHKLFVALGRRICFFLAMYVVAYLFPIHFVSEYKINGKRCMGLLATITPLSRSDASTGFVCASGLPATTYKCVLLRLSSGVRLSSLQQTQILFSRTASAAPSEDRARSSPPATDATASAPTATSNTQPGHVSRSSTDASKTQSDKPSPASADASTDPAPTAESSPARGFYAVTSVSEVQGAEGTVNHRALLATRQPMVVRNDAVVAAWPASSTWTPEHVAAALPVVPAYAQPEQPDFITFHDGKPLEPWVRGPGWDAHNHKHNVSTRTLFGHLRNVPEAVPPAWRWVGAANASHAPGPHLYFSADLRLLAPLWPEALTATEPHAALLVPDAEGVQRNLWLGRAGVATHTHYDAAWNTFAQLHGCKRFTLFPPGSPLHLYPCLHPHLGHSQLRLFPNGDVDGWIDGLAERGFHAAAAEVAANGHVSAYEATLCAGDILLLPPFWYHHVLTLSDSISVNTWSDAPEYVLIHEVYAIAVRERCGERRE